MKKIKIIFMGTPEFSVNPLEALYENNDIEIGLVITGPDKKRSRNRLMPTPVKEKALELGIETYEPQNVNSSESLEKINSYNPDYIVVIAYGQLIGDNLLSNFHDRIINIHSSLLPKYRGAAPMQWAILNKETKTGVCSMLIEKSMDTGDILDCREFKLDKKTDIQTLHGNLSKMSRELIVNTVLNFENLYKNRKVQNNQEASYSKKITKEMGHIDFNEKADDILAKIKAFSIWPSTFAILNGEKVKIHKIDIISKYNDVENGTVIESSDEGVFVNCVNKCIIIKELQFPSKRKMDVKTFLLGNSIESGSKFS